MATTRTQDMVRVVGVAVLRRRGGPAEVLAARRTAPPELAGCWELPGGKAEPGETLEGAAVREIAEELGCVVRVTGQLPGVGLVRPGLTLQVLTAELVVGDPSPLEHDAVRWLSADELDSLDWLSADRPFLPGLRTALLMETEGPV